VNVAPALLCRLTSMVVTYTIAFSSTRSPSRLMAQYGHERMKGAGDAAYPANLLPFIRSCPSET
jgi:hypothetical protein